MNRAAVIIAVRNTGDLPELQAALDGATRVAEWAKAQKFKPIATITDEKKPVTADKIRKAIDKLVQRGDCEQLLIYFAGHGVNLSNSEYWLLSDAPRNTQAAVNVNGSVHLAKRCGIPHVVLVSDACRTAAEGIRAQAVRGSEIFPNVGRGGPQQAVDVFYASLLGEPALEIQDKDAAASRYVSVYTDELVAALRGERRAILAADPEDPARVYLRPQRLKRHLTSEVPKLVAARLGTTASQTQMPDAEILSDEFAFLQSFDAATIHPPGAAARRGGPMGVGAPRRSAPAPAPAAPAATLADVSADALRQALDAPAGAGGEALEHALRSSPVATGAIEKSVAQERETSLPMHYETGWGFKARGAELAAVFVAGGVGFDQLAPELVRIHPSSEPAVNVLLQLTDGRCVVLPAIREFITALTFENGELRNVSYEPSDLSPRWQEYAKKRGELTAMRALVASSVHRGTFRIDSTDAARLTERIRVMKGLDPTMALYAAYSYHRLGEQESIAEMESYVANDLNATFFDLSLLADRDTSKKLEQHVFPFAPMLAQGWSLLGAFGGWTKQLEKLRPFVGNSLWTVYDEGALPLLRKALKEKK